MSTAVIVHERTFKTAMIGLLGGTFNPIHNGHLHLANVLSTSLAFEQIRFIPSAIPPHKASPGVSALHRAAMVQLAIQAKPQYSLDTRELDREGFSYTIDTLISLREALGKKVSVCWLIGTDAFQHLDSWHRWQELIHYAHFVVVRRPQQEPFKGLNDHLAALLKSRLTVNLDDLKSQSSGYICLQEVDALDISSTQIRHALTHRQAVSQLLPTAVVAYIEQHGLYQNEGCF